MNLQNVKYMLYSVQRAAGRPADARACAAGAAKKGRDADKV